MGRVAQAKQRSFDSVQLHQHVAPSAGASGGVSLYRITTRWAFVTAWIDSKRFRGNRETVFRFDGKPRQSLRSLLKKGTGTVVEYVFFGFDGYRPGASLLFHRLLDRSSQCGGLATPGGRLAVRIRDAAGCGVDDPSQQLFVSHADGRGDQG